MRRLSAKRLQVTMWFEMLYKTKYKVDAADYQNFENNFLYKTTNVCLYVFCFNYNHIISFILFKYFGI